MSRVDGEWRQHGEDASIERLDEVRRVFIVERLPIAEDDPSLGQARADVVEERPALPLQQLLHDGAYGPQLFAGAEAVGRCLAEPAATWSRSAATLTWKNSSRLPPKMARNLTRSNSGTLSPSATARPGR